MEQNIVDKQAQKQKKEQVDINKKFKNASKEFYQLVNRYIKHKKYRPTVEHIKFEYKDILDSVDTNLHDFKSYDVSKLSMKRKEILEIIQLLDNKVYCKNSTISNIEAELLCEMTYMLRKMQNAILDEIFSSYNININVDTYED